MNRCSFCRAGHSHVADGPYGVAICFTCAAAVQTLAARQSTILRLIESRLDRSCSFCNSSGGERTIVQGKTAAAICAECSEVCCTILLNP